MPLKLGFTGGFLLLLLSHLFPSGLVWASACCGRNAATPVLLVGDDHSQIGFGIAQSQVAASANEEGTAVLKPSDSSEILTTCRMDAATLLSDRFQIGLTLPVAMRGVTDHEKSETVMGLGDLRVSLGYEMLPAWTYSQWKPQGYVFTTVTFPTGSSIYDSAYDSAVAGSNGIGAIGNGYFSIALGTLFVKRWNDWDLFVAPEGHYSFSREFEMDGGRVLASPGWGGSLGVGGGWSPFGGALRVGLRVQPRIDQGVVNIGLDSVDYRGIQISGLMTSCDTGVDLNYMLTSSDTLSVSYTDQLLLGVAMNTQLNRIFALNYQHRWER